MARSRTDVAASPPDSELILLAAKGDNSAFEELYRRHAEAAWRVAYAVTGNPHDASDAVSEAFTRVFAALPAGRYPAEAPFRPYLLAATRNAAIDGVRRAGRLQPSDMQSLELEAGGASPSDAAIGALDASLVATAFLSLPERWRSVLWLTEVEGLQPREIAGMLGVSANGAAQLAVRARNGLREQFLQAHLRAAVAAGCRFTVDHLGAYVGGALSARDVAKVDQHLAGCEACRERQRELEDIGSTLRRIVLPIPLGLGALAAARWKLAGTVAAHSGAGASRAVAPLGVAAVLMLALGIIGAAVIPGPSESELTTPSREAPREATRPLPVVVAPPIAASAIETITDLADQQAARSRALTAAAEQAGSSDGEGTGGGGSGSAPTQPSPVPGPPDPVLQLSAAGAAVPAALALGDGCTGLSLGEIVIGCPPPSPAPTAGLLTIETHGAILGDNQINL